MQDIVILNDVMPDLTPLSPTKEVLMPADKAIGTYRDWLKKFDDKGWRIDIQQLNKRQGVDKAYSIPCPGRRTSGNWVLDEIPLLTSRAQREKKDQDDAAA